MLSSKLHHWTEPHCHPHTTHRAAIGLKLKLTLVDGCWQANTRIWRTVTGEYKVAEFTMLLYPLWAWRGGGGERRPVMVAPFNPTVRHAMCTWIVTWPSLPARCRPPDDQPCLRPPCGSDAEAAGADLTAAMGKPPPQTPPPYVSIQSVVRIEIIARKFSMHFQCVPLIFTLAQKCSQALSISRLVLCRGNVLSGKRPVWEVTYKM